MKKKKRVCTYCNISLIHIYDVQLLVWLVLTFEAAKFTDITVQLTA